MTQVASFRDTLVAKTTREFPYVVSDFRIQFSFVPLGLYNDDDDSRCGRFSSLFLRAMAMLCETKEHDMSDPLKSFKKMRMV